MSRPPTIDIWDLLKLRDHRCPTQKSASELRRPPETAGRQDPERRTPRLNPPTVTGRCMSSVVPPRLRGIRCVSVDAQGQRLGAVAMRHTAKWSEPEVRRGYLLGVDVASGAVTHLVVVVEDASRSTVTGRSD